MENVQFSKYHALGNDYIVIDPNRSRIELNEDTIRLICHRNFGIGSDGILYGPTKSADGMFELKILNPDGVRLKKVEMVLEFFRNTFLMRDM